MSHSSPRPTVQASHTILGHEISKYLHCINAGYDWRSSEVHVRWGDIQQASITLELALAGAANASSRNASRRMIHLMKALSTEALRLKLIDKPIEEYAGMRYPHESEMIHLGRFGSGDIEYVVVEDMLGPLRAESRRSKAEEGRIGGQGLYAGWTVGWKG